MNPLEEAIQNNNLNQLRLLLDLGHDVNKKTESGKTLLHLATEDCSKEVAELLIAKGADVNVKDGIGNTHLHLAVSENCIEVVELLIAKGADVNEKKLLTILLLI